MTEITEYGKRSGGAEARPSLFMYYCVVSALLGGVSIGLVMGYNAGASLTLYQQPAMNSSSSIIASSTAIGALVGALAAGPISDYGGRKISLICNNVPFVVGWLLIAFIEEVWAVVAGRVITGMASGFMCGVIPVYIIEICSTNVRGLIGCSFQVSITIGLLVANVLGKYIDFKELALASMVTAVLMPCLMLIAPESPIYLMNKVGPSEKTKNVLSMLRKNKNITPELEEMQKQPSEKQAVILGKKELSDPLVYKPLLLSLGLMVFQQGCGINAVIFFQVNIFSQAGVSNSQNAAIAVSAASVVATVVGSVLSLRCGRRILLFLSGCGHTISMFLLAYYFYAKSDPAFAANYAWLAIFSMVFFIVAFSIGFGPIPWMMIPEMTPYAARGFICTLSTFLNWTLVFIITGGFESLTKILTDYGSFVFFGVIAFLSLFFVKFALIETNGKSFEEIKLSFSNKSRKHQDNFS